MFSQLSESWDAISPIQLVSITTDDAVAMKNALASVWPGTRQLLCLFHILQALWRRRWNPNHRVPKERKNLMNDFKRLMYSISMVEVDLNVDSIVYNTDEEEINSSFSRHVTKLYERKEEWVMACRSEIISRGHNYAEATFRIVKDIILTRLKA